MLGKLKELTEEDLQRVRKDVELLEKLGEEEFLKYLMKRFSPTGQESPSEAQDQDK